MLKYIKDERMFPICRLCLLGYSQEEIQDKILFSKNNLISSKPYTFDEINDIYNYFYTNINIKDLERFPECIKIKKEYDKSKGNIKR